MRPACFALGLVAALLAAPLRAQTLHRTLPGESLGELAQRYYGDASLAELIASHNKLDKGLRPGTELRLPSASRHEVARGESWNDLAARFWSDASLGSALARWSGFEPGSSPLAGTRLEIPALFVYRLKPGETLTGLARRFERDPSRAALLGELNRLRDPERVHAGQLLRIPVQVSAREDALAPETASTQRPPASGKLQLASARSDAASSASLMGAVNAYLDGDFETALTQLERQRPGTLAHGSPAERELLYRYLIFSYVAFDRADAACDAWAGLRGIDAKSELDPELVSPKIRDALARCD